MKLYTLTLLACVVVVRGQRPWQGPQPDPCLNPGLGTWRHLCRCESHPCKNGATCNNILPGAYTCTCAAGWTGTNCDTDIDNCASNPCMNDGTCTNLLNAAYECSCAAGWTGTNCNRGLGYIGCYEKSGSLTMLPDSLTNTPLSAPLAALITFLSA